MKFPRSRSSRPDGPLRTASLRRRVAAVVLLFLVVVLVGLGLMVNMLLGTALRADLKTRLEDRASYAGLLQEQGVTGQALADKLAGAGIFSAFTSGNRHYVGRDTDTGGPRLRPGGPPLRPAVPPVISYAESDGQLTATVSLSNGSLTLQASEVDIHRTLSELARIELLAGGGAVLLAGLVLIRLIGVALRPLDRMTSLARRIRDGTRGRRLRPTRPRTDLGRTAGAFDEMLDALEAAEAQAQAAEIRMRQFLADASHDLRTPLAGVIAGSEQLLRTPAGRAERELRLVAVVRQARRAARLVDDLLLMTRLDSAAAADAVGQQLGAIDRFPASLTSAPGPVDLFAVLHREVDALRLRRPDLDISLTAPPVAALVTGDADQLHRAVGNVLDNASRATPRGAVAIELSVTGAAAVVRVTDTGPGVPTADRERIFDRFVRLSDARSGEGSGLGLPICRAILRSHGGDVHCVDLRPGAGGSGACFEVRLPLLPAPARPVPTFALS